MGLLEKFSKKLGGGEKSEDMDIEEYLDTLGLENEDLLEEEANQWVRALNLQDSSDTETVIKEVRDGNLVLLNIEPLYKRNTIKLKQAISDIKGVVNSVNGDLARLSEYRLLVTPSGTKFSKSTPGKAR
jgi:SepF-like predicted cell division protein (DUF552 family)